MQFADLRGVGGAWQERGGLFLRGVDTPTHVYQIFMYIKYFHDLSNEHFLKTFQDFQCDSLSLFSRFK